MNKALSLGALLLCLLNIGGLVKTFCDTKSNPLLPYLGGERNSKMSKTFTDGTSKLRSASYRINLFTQYQSLSLAFSNLLAVSSDLMSDYQGDHLFESEQVPRVLSSHQSMVYASTPFPTQSRHLPKNQKQFQR